MAFLLGITIILGVSLAPLSFFRRKIDEVLPLTVYSVILILYIMGLAGRLKVGVYLVAVLSILSLFGTALYTWNNKKFTLLKKNLLTPGLAVFFVAAVVIFLALKGRRLTEWDEFSHWGLVVKNMDVFNAFGNIPEATTHFKGYPPASALFQYFFVKLGRPFTEAYLPRALDLWIIALLLPFLKNLSWKNWKDVLLRGAIAFLVPAIFYSQVYTTIYVDALLGIVFAQILYSYFSEKEWSPFSILNVSLGVCILPLIKASGAGLAAIALIIIAVDIIVRRKMLFGPLQIAQKKEKIKTVALMALPVVGFLFGKQSWALYLKVSQTAEAWNTSTVTLDNIKTLFTPEIAEYRVKTIETFSDSFFSVQEIGSWKVSPFLWFAILLILGILAACLCKDGMEKKRLLFLQGGMTAGFTVYTISLLILYLFTYSEYEAQRVASFHRYIYTYLLGFALVVTFLLLDCERNASHHKRMIPTLALLTVISLAPMKEVANFVLWGQFYNAETQKSRQEYNTSEQLQVSFDSRQEKVYFVCQNSSGYDYWVVRYNLTPVPVLATPSWSLGPPYSAQDVWTVNISADEWEQTLVDGAYTYVYLYRVDDQFKGQFGSLFENQEQIQSDRFYKVIQQDDGGVQLQWDSTKV